MNATENISTEPDLCLHLPPDQEEKTLLLWKVSRNCLKQSHSLQLQHGLWKYMASLKWLRLQLKMATCYQVFNEFIPPLVYFTSKA